jgi:hypothetical protein
LLPHRYPLILPHTKGEHKGKRQSLQHEQHNSNNGKGKRKGTKKKESSNKKIMNNNQIVEFKMANGETWEKTFQGKCPDSRVEFMGT